MNDDIILTKTDKRNKIRIKLTQKQIKHQYGNNQKKYLLLQIKNPSRRFKKNFLDKKIKIN